MDGYGSHTHGVGLELDQFIWREGAEVLATTLAPLLKLSVGVHTIVLTVIDDGFNEAEDRSKLLMTVPRCLFVRFLQFRLSSAPATVTVLPYGYPAIISISPESGSIAGNEIVTITGSGFTANSADTIVHFGLIDMTGNDLIIESATTIKLLVPASVVGAPVSVSVETPLEVSNAIAFTYVAGVPIEFQSDLLSDSINAPTVVKFGPDRALYVGTIDGKVARLTFDKEDYTTVTSTVISGVANWRCILGMAFDPMDTDDEPSVYVTTSFFFHVSYFVYIFFCFGASSQSCYYVVYQRMRL